MSGTISDIAGGNTSCGPGDVDPIGEVLRYGDDLSEIRALWELLNKSERREEEMFKVLLSLFEIKEEIADLTNGQDQLTSEMENSFNQLTSEMENSSNQTKALICKNMDSHFEKVNGLIRLLSQQVTTQLILISEKIPDKNVRDWTSTLTSCIVFLLNVTFNAFITSVVVYYCVRDPSRIPGIL